MNVIVTSPLSRPAVLALGAAVLLAAPLLWLLIGAGGTAATAARSATPPPTPPSAPAADCRERPLAHGLSDDPRAGAAYAREGVLGAHPPLPRPGFRAPGAAPGPAVVVHALVHRWVVVTYRPSAAADVARVRRLAARLRGARVLVVPGTAAMPVAVGAVAWGAQITCTHGERGLDAIVAFARRHAAV